LKPNILIVDGYSTGADLTRALVQNEAQCFHIRSTSAIPPVLAPSFDASLYSEDLGFLGEDVALVAGVVASREICRVVAGCDTGVVFADALAQALGCSGNDPKLRDARKHKFLMLDALTKTDVPVPAQMLTADVEAATAWATKRACWPVIVKPVASAASDGVCVCKSIEDIGRAFSLYLHRRNILGELNTELLVQEYLAGEQYIVNTVSSGGRHSVSDAWHVRFGSKDLDLAQTSKHLLDPDSPTAHSLFDYTKKCLDGLGVVNGASHTELRLTDKGPRLIEVNARVMGGILDPGAYAAAAIQTHPQAYACTLVSERNSGPAMPACSTYRMTRHFCKAYFLFGENGLIASCKGLDRLAGLASYYNRYRPLSVGSRVRRSTNTLHQGGVVHLISNDLQQIEADLATMRQWDKDGILYTITAQES
jgi:hypothetical protein